MQKMKFITRWRWALVVLLALVAAGSVALVTQSASSELIREDDHLWEKVAVFRYHGDLYVANIPDIESLSALANYWWASDDRVSMLKPNEKTIIQALVTFREPLFLSQVEEVLAEVEITRVRFVDNLDGGGQMPYPIDMDLISKVEELAAESAAQAGAESGAFFTGFTAAQITGERCKMLDLENVEDIFLLEIGPIEYLEEFPDAQVTLFDDVAYEYEKYVIPVCTINQLRTLLISKNDAGLIDDPGVFNSFLVKVDEATTKISEGQNKTARNILSAFINEGHAQAGKHVEKTAAGELIIVAECVRYSLLRYYDSTGDAVSSADIDWLYIDDDTTALTATLHLDGDISEEWNYQIHFDYDHDTGGPSLLLGTVTSDDTLSYRFEQQGWQATGPAGITATHGPGIGGGTEIVFTFPLVSTSLPVTAGDELWVWADTQGSSGVQDRAPDTDDHHEPDEIGEYYHYFLQAPESVYLPIILKSQ